MNADSDPFWDALEDGRFLLPSCVDCGEAFFPPAPVCPRCHATAVEWLESDATGSLYAFTRQHRTAPGVPSPLVLGIVELDEGPRLLARLRTGMESASDSETESGSTSESETETGSGSGSESAFDALTIGDRVRLEACEYAESVDRGRLSDRPFFEARPLE